MTGLSPALIWGGEITRRTPPARRGANHVRLNCFRLRTQRRASKLFMFGAPGAEEHRALLGKSRTRDPDSQATSATLGQYFCRLRDKFPYCPVLEWRVS